MEQTLTGRAPIRGVTCWTEFDLFLTQIEFWIDFSDWVYLHVNGELIGSIYGPSGITTFDFVNPFFCPRGQLELKMTVATFIPLRECYNVTVCEIPDIGWFQSSVGGEIMYSNYHIDFRLRTCASPSRPLILRVDKVSIYESASDDEPESVKSDEDE